MSEKTKEQDAVTFKETGSLDDFIGFENTTNGPGDDFWDDDTAEVNTDAKTVVEDVEVEESKKTTEEIADELFTDTEIDEEVETEVDDEPSGENDIEKENTSDEVKKKTTPKATSVSTIELLKEKGLIDYELEEGEELTEELADNLIEDKFDEGVDNRIEELFGELPDIVKQLNKFAMNGGDVNKFFNQIATTSASTLKVGMDLEKEENQEIAIRQILKAEDNDDDYIDSQIEFLKDSGRLKSFAEKKYNKWEESENRKQQELFNKQANLKKKQKEQLREYKKNLTRLVSETEDLGEIKLSRRDRKDLPSYVADKNIKLQNGALISQRDKDLYEVLQDEKASLQLAYLLRNRNKDKSFNFKNIETLVTTKVAKKVKENVRRNKTNTPKKSGSSGSSQRRELADYF